jgi:acetyl esterase/lipase
MRRSRLGLALYCVLGLALSLRAADDPKVLELWPGKAPGETADIGAEQTKSARPDGPITSITNVSRPTIAVHKPPRDKDTGVAVIVAPGGGYNNLAIGHEGDDVAAWLNSIGVTGIVLKYRVPRRPDQPRDKPPIGALQDAQRALSLVRSHAAEWGIDPQRVGLLGFSAGGHLTAWAATNFDTLSYDPIDDADKQSHRPDFAVMIYPGGVTQRDDPTALSPEVRVSSQTPPCFFAHAYDDRVSPENSIRMFLALKQAGVPAELHVYSTGGHGFGLRPSKNPCSTWPQRCEEWLKSQGVLK